MRLGVLSPRGTGEKRVAATPDTIKAYRKAGHDVIIEAGAGQGIASSDADYEAAGATIGDPYQATVLLVVGPADVDSARLRAEHVVVGMLDPYESQGLDRLASSGCQVRTGGFWTLPLRRQRVQTQIRRLVPSIRARTRCRLGCQVRDVTLWAWLMLRPVTVDLSQISHFLAMEQTPWVLDAGARQGIDHAKRVV